SSSGSCRRRAETAIQREGLAGSGHSERLLLIPSWYSALSSEPGMTTYLHVRLGSDGGRVVWASLRQFNNECRRRHAVFEGCAMLTSLFGNMWLMIPVWSP